MDRLALMLLLINLVGVIVCHDVARSRGQKVLFWTTLGIVFGVLAIPFVLRTRVKSISQTS